MNQAKNAPSFNEERRGGSAGRKVRGHLFTKHVSGYLKTSRGMPRQVLGGVRRKIFATVAATSYW